MMNRVLRILLLFSCAVPVLAQGNGVVIGTPTFGAVKFSNGLTATSDSNYISLPTGTFPNSNYVTWEAWLKTSVTATSVAVSSPVGGTDAFWMGVVNSNGNGDFGFGQGTHLQDSLIHIADGNWHHCVVEFAPTAMYTFVDGVAGASAPYAFVAPASTAMAIGRYQSAGYGWTGSIDEVAIWNFQKYTPVAQGGTAYTVPTAPYVGNESGLVALYHLQADGTDSASPGNLAITTTSLPTGSIGAAYSQTLTATGGTSPYTWSLYSGALPAGLSPASTGVISGSPTTAGTSSFVMQAKDSVGNTAISTSLSITIASNTTYGPFNGVVVGSPTFGAAKFSNGLTAASDSNYISLPTGTFPSSNDVTWEAWLKTSSPSTSVALSSPVGGTDAFWMGVVSSNGNGNLGFGQGTHLQDSLIRIADGNWHHCVVEFTPTTMYTFVDGVAGASAPYTFVAPASTAMAIGRYQSAGYGWSGSIDEVAIWNYQKYTPVAQGGTAYTVPTAPYVGNESGLVALYHLQADGTDGVGSGTGANLAITTTSLAEGSIGGAYSQTLTATGGTSPYTWSLYSGALPAGLSLASTGVISGSPTTAGTASFVVEAKDSAGNTATSPLSITIANNTTISPLNSSIVYSPFNWNVQNGVASTINSGAYFRTIFSGTSAALATNTAPNASPYPQIWARVDNQGWQLFTLSAGNPLLTVATGLSSGQKHILEVVVKSTSEFLNRWTSSQTVVQFTGIVLDGGTTVTAPIRRSKNVLIYGDSITEGYHVYGAGDVTTSDALGCYSYALTAALDAEVGVVGFGGQGVNGGGQGGVPAFPSSYNYIYSGVSRSFTSPAPDLVIYNMGTNDGGSITSGLEQVVAGIAAVAPNAKQLILVPFNQTHISDIQAVVTGMGSANVSYAPTAGWFNPADSSDGVHPYGYSHLEFIAPKLFPIVEPLAGP